MSETLGWRWAFLIQLPVIALSYLMVTCFLTYHHPPSSNIRQRLAKIDWVGALLLTTSVSRVLVLQEHI